jgi:AhpD family alkylhydroperoxidase
MDLDAVFPIPVRLKEPAQLQVAMMVGCPFCIHSAVGRKEGITEPQLQPKANSALARVRPATLT